MRYIKLFESYKKDVNIKYFMFLSKKIYKDIFKISKIDDVEYNLPSEENEYKFSFLLKGVKLTKKIINILDSYKSNLIKNNLILSYGVNDEVNNANYNISKHHIDGIIIYIRDLVTIRVKPKNKIYHLSSYHNRESILQNGLLIHDSSYGVYNHTASLEYPPAIFAFNRYPNVVDLEYDDIWEIDTNGLTNLWYKDLNNLSYDETCIMTFEIIPKTHIKLYKKAKKI